MINPQKTMNKQFRAIRNWLGKTRNLLGTKGNWLGTIRNLLGTRRNWLGKKGNWLGTIRNLSGTKGNGLETKGNLFGTIGNLSGTKRETLLLRCSFPFILIQKDFSHADGLGGYFNILIFLNILQCFFEREVHFRSDAHILIAA